MDGKIQRYHVDEVEEHTILAKHCLQRLEKPRAFGEPRTRPEHFHHKSSSGGELSCIWNNKSYLAILCGSHRLNVRSSSYNLSFSSNGKILASARDNCTAFLRDTQTGEESR
ncbi:hypothetical protein K461DRAFT_275603 [Myriangium duriaei CBS 260.36]|uniref:Uncharacterized protein n=1 Tax=Myriangium duriaei CBS 260.36 TaxID=1168546 RepID=A0A9P4MKN6_9PEZI|nr:hypothetical protein K461DRAFT_275603 [Myriangium duriaei CBS 260.36]